MNHELVRAWVDREIVGELARSQRGSLHDHLRSCAACRDYYDRGMTAIRVLERSDGPSGLELDMVEEWLFEVPSPDASVGAHSWWARPWAVMAAALVTVFALLVLLPRQDASMIEGLTARGTAAGGGLALQVLCGEPLRAADERGCGLDEKMTFAYRLAGEHRAQRLVLFGVDERGNTLYYAPTPLDGESLPAEAGAWRAAELTIDLVVNHDPGPITVYGLVTTNAVAAADVDAWATDLSRRPRAELGEDPWPQRMSSELISGMCGDGSPCPSAEFSLVLHEAPK